MILDKLLSFFTEDLNGSATPVDDIEWGKETIRLPPAPAQIWSVEKTGKAEPLPPADPLPSPPEDLVRFLKTQKDCQTHAQLRSHGCTTLSPMRPRRAATLSAESA